LEPYGIAVSERNGGRTWWAHFEFARINIAPTILRKKIEDLRVVGAFVSMATWIHPSDLPVIFRTS
jgi:hypothetical protein